MASKFLRKAFTLASDMRVIFILACLLFVNVSAGLAKIHTFKYQSQVSHQAGKLFINVSNYEYITAQLIPTQVEPVEEDTFESSDEENSNLQSISFSEFQKYCFGLSEITPTTNEQAKTHHTGVSLITLYHVWKIHLA